MAYVPHLLLSFGGRLFAAEQWNCGLRMFLGDPQTLTPATGPLLGLVDAWAEVRLEDAANDLAAWMIRSDSLLSSAARLDWVKLNVIQEDGSYWNAEATHRFDFDAGSAPAGTVTPTYAQVTVAVSLLTDAARGLAHRGRIFTPTGSVGPDAATGRVDAINAGRIADSAILLLNDLANEPGIDTFSPRAIVASNIGSPGPARSITSVSVGLVPDTQRRRRSSLPEEHVARGPVVIE